MKNYRLLALSVTPLFLLLGVTASQKTALAQGAGDESSWQAFSPEGEEFSVVMPKDPKSEQSDEPYHRMTLHTHLYLSATDHGPVFAVASLSGIKANSAMYTEVQRLNSYVDAFKNWFPKKVRGQDAVAKLTLVGDKTLNGNSGREYRMAIGELAGTAQVYTTRKRFYAVVALNTKKDDQLAERFLTSLVLPEKITQPALVVAEKLPAPENAGNTKQPKNENTVESQKNDPAAIALEAKPGDAVAPAKPSGERAPISGGVLNGKAIILPKPEYPAEAKAAGASGPVAVQVTIDESGNVINAKAVSGHPLLQQACINAAYGARFSPTTLMGEPVKVSGVITYNFVAK